VSQPAPHPTRDHPAQPLTLRTADRDRRRGEGQPTRGDDRTKPNGLEQEMPLRGPIDGPGGDGDHRDHRRGGEQAAPQRAGDRAQIEAAEVARQARNDADDVHGGSERGGECQAGVAEVGGLQQRGRARDHGGQPRRLCGRHRADQGQTGQRIGGQRGEGRQDRRAHIAERVERGHDYPRNGERPQADRVGLQRDGRALHVIGAECPVLQQHGRDRPGQHEQRERGWYGEHGRQAHRKVQAAAQLRVRPAHRLIGEAGQRGGADGHRDQTDGELEDAAGVPQRSDATGGQHRRDAGAHHDVDLVGGGAERARTQQPQHATDRRMARLPVRRQAHAAPGERDHLRRELQCPAQEHAPDEREDRVWQRREQRDRATDHRQVEQHRGQGRREEVALRVQKPAQQRDQADQQQVREEPARQLHGQRQRLGVGAEAWRQELDPVRRQRHAEQGHDGDDHRQAGGKGTQGALGLGRGMLSQVLREDRNEGHAHRPFADEATEEIGQAEGNEEGIRHGAGTEVVSGHDVAQQPGDAARQREARHHAGRAGDTAVFAHPAGSTQEGSEGPRVEGSRSEGFAGSRVEDRERAWDEGSPSTLAPLDPRTLGPFLN
jgi:hypothetical protein